MKEHSPAGDVATVPCHVSVLIPARNEEDLLERCLVSVQAARAALPEWCTSDAVVVADSCEDQTCEIAERVLGGSGAAVRANAGMVGAARALAARSALRRFQGPVGLCWLANTDADCEVPADWLLRQLGMAACGVHAVAGTVEVHDFSEHLHHVPQRFRDTYLIGADGTHPHVHGANLGLRADAYLGAGGWAPLPTAEDHDLWRRLHAKGYTRQSVGSLRVVTSGRRTGRAPLGFADALAAHNEYVV